MDFVLSFFSIHLHRRLLCSIYVHYNFNQSQIYFKQQITFNWYKFKEFLKKWKKKNIYFHFNCFVVQQFYEKLRVIAKEIKTLFYFFFIEFFFNFCVFIETSDLKHCLRDLKLLLELFLLSSVINHWCFNIVIDTIQCCLQYYSGTSLAIRNKKLCGWTLYVNHL